MTSSPRNGYMVCTPVYNGNWVKYIVSFNNEISKNSPHISVPFGTVHGTKISCSIGQPYMKLRSILKFSTSSFQRTIRANPPGGSTWGSEIMRWSTAERNPTMHLWTAIVLLLGLFLQLLIVMFKSVWVPSRYHFCNMGNIFLYL